MLNVFKFKNKYSVKLFCCIYCWVWPQSAYQDNVSTFEFEQVFVSRVDLSPVVIIWKHKKMIYLFCNKNCKAYFVKQYIIAPNWNELKCSKFAWSWVFSMLTFLLRYNFSPFKHTHNQLNLQKNSAHAENIVHKKVELQATFFVCLERCYTNLWFSTNQIEKVDKQTKLRWWVIVDQSHMAMLPVWRTV